MVIKNKTEYRSKEKGTALLLVVLILVVVLVISFGISGLMLGEIKLSGRTSEALMSYYAAEAGIERSLYDERHGSGASDIGNPPDCLSVGNVCLQDPNSCYVVDFENTGDGISIKSYGCYRKTKRAIEILY